MRHDNDLLNKFSKFADYGITESEIKAATEVLRRELGCIPTIFQVAEYIDEQIQWRHFHRKWRNGEVTHKYVYTKKGKQIRDIAGKVNNIFHRKGGDKK